MAEDMEEDLEVVMDIMIITEEALDIMEEEVLNIMAIIDKNIKFTIY
jgi:hypothetical protein